MSGGSSIDACTIPVSLATDVLKGLEMSFKKYLARVQRANIQSYRVAFLKRDIALHTLSQTCTVYL